ncbi:MAG: hypothetical protein LBS24_08540 [Clostridiales Family XIII bacterium]|jgi:Mn-dependent DtxR family transcriptional regulator|nr:hypothetical protein [Clostridiales Family XIII bacterium]
MQKENISLFFKGGASEDCLMTVYEACKETGGSAQQVEIAARMGFSKPSVVRGLRILAQKGFVTIVSDVNSKCVYLTGEGRALAEKLLGLSEVDAATEARLWEHGVSDETASAMEAARIARKRRVPSATRKKSDEIRHVF